MSDTDETRDATTIIVKDLVFQKSFWVAMRIFCKIYLITGERIRGVVEDAMLCDDIDIWDFLPTKDGHATGWKCKWNDDCIYDDNIFGREGRT